MRLNGQLVFEVLGDGRVLNMEGELLHRCENEEERMELVSQMLEED